MKRTDIDNLLVEQLHYYRVGAAEYDKSNRGMLALIDGAAWWSDYRRGYDSAVAVAEAVAEGRDVIEFAGGSGLYTASLARRARKLTVVDASPEALDINKTTVGAHRPDIEYVLADLFSWQPSRRYDVVFFAFWLSHVPHFLFDNFWEKVCRSLTDGGDVAFVDSMAPVSPPVARPAPQEYERFPEERVDDEVSVRMLADGSRFRIVRVLWERPALRARLKELGWEVRYDESSAWLVGTACRAARQRG